jgi:hypothetical protein
MLLYGLSKSGKSTLSATAPGKKLVLDLEQGYRFIPGLKFVRWDPVRDAPPEDDGSWDTCLVSVPNYESVMRVYQWLHSGKHPFNSVIIDSLSELQVKLMDDITNRGPMQMQAWGEVLRQLTGLTRDMRDLVSHPTRPIQCVIFIAMAKEDNRGKRTPYLQGQSATIIPYIVDICGYLAVESYPHADPTQGRYAVRRMYLSNYDDAMVGQRVGGRLGDIVEQRDLNVSNMIDRIYTSDDQK